jgi:dipeptidyl aminopeptidase/acylaminoacyl peptidase
MGESMGGLLAYLCPLDYPDLFAAIASIYGVANLTWRYYGIDSPGLSRSEDINMAYGCTEQSFFYKTCLHNVHNRLPELVRFPLKCWHGDADKIVGLNQSRYTVDEVNALGGNASLVVVPGAGHGHKSGIRDSSVIDFFVSIPNIALTGQGR